MLGSLTVALLGLYLGANLTEGFVLVPYWRSLPAGDFFAWYAANDSRLLGFFSPVTAVAALAVVAAALVSFRQRATGKWHALLTAALIIAAVLMFPLYFEQANASFTAGSLGAGELSTQLERWERWHWVRTFLIATALVINLVRRNASSRPDCCEPLAQQPAPYAASG